MSGFIEDGIRVEKQATEAGKRTVFLIGDSIRLGYCATVKEELKELANVVYPTENCRYTQHVLTNLHNWVKLCDTTEVAVVQFNCGHWDVAHWHGEEESLNTVEVYAHNLVRIAKKLRGYFPNAKLVFATTTGMNPLGIQGNNIRTTAEITAYNKAARAALPKEVEILDLFALTAEYGPEMFQDYCHFTEEAFALIGKQVAERLRALLQE